MERTLIYEGEYLNGKKNGKGKEYFNNDNLKFEGEYKNGMEKEKNFVLNRNFLKENIIMVKDGMEYIKYIMIKIN